MTRTGDREIGVVSGRVGMYVLIFFSALCLYTTLHAWVKRLTLFIPF